MQINEWKKEVEEKAIGWQFFATVHQSRVGKDQYVDEFKRLFGYDPDCGSNVSAFCETVHDVCKQNLFRESKILEENGRHVFRIVKEKIDKAEETCRFKVGMKVEYDSKSEVLSFMDTEGYESLMEMIRTTFESYKQSVSDVKFRQNYKNVILKDGKGISLKQNGGIYFIPCAYEGAKINVKDGLEEMFKKFGNELITIPFPAVGGAKVAMYAVLEEAEKVEQEILEKMSTGKRKKINGLKTMQSDASDVADKMSGYMKALEMAQKTEAFGDELVNKCKSKVESLITLANKLSEQIEEKEASK